MKTAIAYNNQTVFDLAIEKTGSIESVFSFLESNKALCLDLSIPAGYRISLPDKTINADVVDYFQRGGLHVISGIGQEIVLSDEDMSCIKQTLQYNLSAGPKSFPAVRLYNLSDHLTVQINYSGLSSAGVRIYIDQSLDGINFSVIPEGESILDPLVGTHTYNIIGLSTKWVRARIEMEMACEGFIHEIFFYT